MTLDDLKSEWSKRDAALTRSLNLHTALLRDALIDTRRAKIRRRAEMGPFGIAVWILTLLLLGSFIASHWGQWRFVAPAALIHVWTIAIGAIGFQQRAELNAIDYAAAPTLVQQRLASIRAARARVVQWAFLTGQVIWWIPFFIVFMKGALNVDLYALSDFMRLFLAVNVAIGIAFMPLAWIGARILSARLRGSSSWHAFIDMVAGRDLAEARALADRLAKFEQEATA
jgi:hypothetical protein